MDVFTQRLLDEFSMPVIITAPMVSYRVVLKDGTEMHVERPGDFPTDQSTVLEYYEPMARGRRSR
jgi:translation elongation factor EF-4